MSAHGMSRAVPRVERFVRCVLALQRGQAVNSPWLMRTLGVSHAQAVRDLNELERLLPVNREGGRLTLLDGGRS